MGRGGGGMDRIGLWDRMEFEGVLRGRYGIYDMEMGSGGLQGV